MNEPATVPPPLVFEAPLGERVFVTGCAVFMGALALFLVAVMIGSFVVNIALGFVMLVAVAAIGAMVFLVTKEAVSRWRMRVTFYAGRMTALLPRRRGFIDMKREEIEIAISDVDRVETRLEIYSSIGVTTAQRAFSIVLRDGTRIALGADRDWVQPFWGRIADELAARAGAGLIDLGAVDGDAGFLLVAGQSAPEWSAASLAPAEIEVRNRRRARTAAIMSAAALIVLLAQILARR